MQSHSVCTRGVHVVRHEAQGEQSLKHRVHVGKIGIDAILRGAVVSFPLVDAHLVLLDQSLPLQRFAIASFQAASCACACACAAEGRGNVVIHRVIDQFQGDDNGHVGRPGEVSLTPPYPELFASYWSSAVTRTSGRGHVAEAKTNVIEVSGFSIRVSKETLLTLNVHFCVQLPAQRC